jgi:hypothetical protein
LSTEVRELDLGEREVRRPNPFLTPLLALSCVLIVWVDAPLGVIIAVLASAFLPFDRAQSLYRRRAKRRVWVRPGTIRIGDEPIAASELCGASVGIAADAAWLRIERRVDAAIEIKLDSVEQANQVCELIGAPRAASFVQWLALASSPGVQLSIAILLPISIATPWLVPKILIAAGYFAFAGMRWSVQLGRDGITYGVGSGRRFVSLCDVERAERAGSGVVLRCARGERVKLRGLFERDADALERWISRELASFRARGEQPLAAALLAPQGRSGRTWHARLERLRAEPGYRREQLLDSDLLDVLMDPQVEPGARAAAAALVDDRDHARLARVACETAHPQLSRMLLRTANGDVAREQRLALVTRRFSGSG